MCAEALWSQRARTMIQTTCETKHSRLMPAKQCNFPISSWAIATGPLGLVDNASDFESEDCGLKSRRGCSTCHCLVTGRLLSSAVRCALHACAHIRSASPARDGHATSLQTGAVCCSRPQHSLTGRDEGLHLCQRCACQHCAASTRLAGGNAYSSACIFSPCAPLA